MKLKFNRLITHDTTFHADDVIAVALLIVAGYDGFSLSRTRDKATVEEALRSSETLILDTGMAYDPVMLNFDHHQDKNLLSAAGLIYNEIKDELLAEEAQPYFEKWISSIDAIDTNRDHIYHLWDQLPSGFRHTSSILGGFNRDPSNAEEQDRQFGQAVEMAKSIILNEIYSATKKAESERQYASRVVLENNVAVFDDYSTVWKEKRDHMFVVMPHANGWQIQTIDTALDLIPESISLAPGFSFRHMSGFMATLDTKENAVSFAATLPHHPSLHKNEVVYQ
ncbi:MYG1 family protein [Dyadobacter fermentans]|uniref:Metal-dependent protein hydrolase n=1 Tax=Dyadobacter fermentans (strain ATCC 700827 / DSM 18053 / CIP 107007 / KCTC 52180 / NS114) TaxID=471854 RepID=C6VVG1_DYAFD|nr:MYG1 family protein [Dyadobacter fermentans]ACT96691.1 conserved hypothetical protein [Dyadobacter fermentans DSM 18053]